MNVVYNRFSAYTGDDLADIERQIKDAQKVYKERFDRYMASVNAGHESYAAKNFLPAANEAKAYLDDLQKTHTEMLDSISKNQGIDLTDLAAQQSLDNSQSSIPWTTIGLAVGALIVIVIIVKLF